MDKHYIYNHFHSNHVQNIYDQFTKCNQKLHVSDTGKYTVENINLKQ